MHYLFIFIGAIYAVAVFVQFLACAASMRNTEAAVDNVVPRPSQMAPQET